MSNIESYIDNAVAGFEAGFKSKAAKNEALGNLSSAYGALKNEILELVLAVDRDARSEDHDAVYWGLADNLSHWKPRHSELVLRVFPDAAELVARIEEIAEFRAAVKAAPVVKAERDPAADRAESVTRSVRELMELRGAKYERALNLHDMFNGLPVHANVHLVTNHCGTTFLRAFYYLAGELTPLAVIIAAAETKSSN